MWPLLYKSAKLDLRLTKVNVPTFIKQDSACNKHQHQRERLAKIFMKFLKQAMKAIARKCDVMFSLTFFQTFS